MSRIQVILNEQERELFRQQAMLEGLSLSAWIREAALVHLAARQRNAALNSVEALEAFFTECDRYERGREPDWTEHLQVINRSLGSGDSST